MNANDNWSLGEIMHIADTAIIIIPFLLLVLLIWLAAKVCSFLSRLFSEGGMSAREQQHRHKLENFACRMTFLCFVAGICIIAAGQDAGLDIVKDIKLPGGIEIGSAGAGVVLIGVGNSLLWMLLNFRKTKPETDVDAQPVTSAATKASHASPASGWLASMSYWHVALITLILCPALNLFAVPAGILLAWQVAKSKKLTARTLEDTLHIAATSPTSVRLAATEDAGELPAARMARPRTPFPSFM